jgi:hypothetical protein
LEIAVSEVSAGVYEVVTADVTGPLFRTIGPESLNACRNSERVGTRAVRYLRSRAVDRVDEMQVVVATNTAQNDIADAQRRWIDRDDGTELPGLDAAGSPRWVARLRGKPL